jgi:hypothetical protein
MGLGVAALVTSSALAGIEGHPSNMVCNAAGDAGKGDCVYSNRALFSVGFVLGTGLVIGGGILLWQARKRSVNVNVTR